MNNMPTGWTDDGTILTSPTGRQCDGDIRDELFRCWDLLAVPPKYASQADLDAAVAKIASLTGAETALEQEEATLAAQEQALAEEEAAVKAEEEHLAGNIQQAATDLAAE